MKKLFKTLAVLAAVAALGFGFASCSNDDDSSSGGGNTNNNSGNNNSGNNGNASTAITKEKIQPKNFTVTQKEGTNFIVVSWTADVMEDPEGKDYHFTRKITVSPSSDESKQYDINGLRGSVTSGTEVVFWDSELNAPMESGKYTFTLNLSYKSDSIPRIETEPVTVSFDYEHKLVTPVLKAVTAELYTSPYSTDYTHGRIDCTHEKTGNYYLVLYINDSDNIANAMVIGYKWKSGDSESSYENFDTSELKSKFGNDFKSKTFYLWLKSADGKLEYDGNHVIDSDKYSSQSNAITFNFVGRRD